MKIFLSGTDTGHSMTAVKRLYNESRESGKPPMPLPDESRPFMWNLMSYHYIKNGGLEKEWAPALRDASRLLLIDSGAHSFQKGKKVNWEDFTHEYAAFISRFDRPNVLGYFEMDIDNIIGYDGVKALRRILENESGCPDKIIPVWHKGRGIEDFRRMCEENAGRIVSITGWQNEDIRDEQYPMFLKYAHQCGCRVHCLGMTRKKILDRVPFDFVDSASWSLQAKFGRIGTAKVSRAQTDRDWTHVFATSYKVAMEMQLKYWRKWRRVNHDAF